MARRTYVIYDGRAALGDTDDSSVCCCADTLEEAKQDVRDMFPDGIVYSYEYGEDGKLINERFEWQITEDERGK